MSAPAICSVCGEEIHGNDYRLAGYDHKTRRSPMAHYPGPCWERREELRAQIPGVQVVGTPTPGQPMMIQGMEVVHG